MVADNTPDGSDEDHQSSFPKSIVGMSEDECVRIRQSQEQQFEAYWRIILSAPSRLAWLAPAAVSSFPTQAATLGPSCRNDKRVERVLVDKRMMEKLRSLGYEACTQEKVGQSSGQTSAEQTIDDTGQEPLHNIKTEE